MVCFPFANGISKFAGRGLGSLEIPGMFWPDSFTMKYESSRLFCLILSVLLFGKYSNQFEIFFSVI